MRRADDGTHTGSVGPPLEAVEADPAVLTPRPERRGMDTVRQGLRAGDIEKDTYERLTCAHCGESLATRDTDDGVGKIRSCPDCDREYKEL